MLDLKNISRNETSFLRYPASWNRQVKIELFLEPSGDSLFPLPKQTIKSQHTQRHTRTITKSWSAICRRGESMVEETRCSLALALSFQRKHVSVEMAGVEGWRKGEKWMKRGIVKSVGSHRIVVGVKRSRLTTHGDCLTSSRLDWSWPAALCSTALDAPMHSPKMHSTVVKAATLVPHARFGQFEFALPPTFPARTRDKPVAYECEARARRSTLDSKRSPIPIPILSRENSFFNRSRSFFFSSSLQSINGKLSELFLRNFNFLLVQLLFKFWRELDGEFGTVSLVTVVPAERGNLRRDNAFNNQCPVARTSMTGISVVIGV